jgi:LSD1 subclass zinc finger protein
VPWVGFPKNSELQSQTLSPKVLKFLQNKISSERPHNFMKTRFRSLLVCPFCRGELAYPEAPSEIRCLACAGVFGFGDNGAPALICEGGALEGQGATNEGLNLTRRASAPPLVRWAKRFLPRPEMVWVRPKDHAKVVAFIESIEKRGGLILNLGGGNTDYGPNVLNVDLYPGKYVDLIASGTQLPFPDGAFDGVTTMAVLEHVPDFEAVRGELLRVTRPGGECFHAVPFIQPFHASPHDYRRFTLSGLECAFPGFTRVDSGVIAGPGSAIAWLLREYFSVLTSFGSVLLYNAGMWFWGWAFWILKFTDLFLADQRFATQLASGFYFRGKKTE